MKVLRIAEWLQTRSFRTKLLLSIFVVVFGLGAFVLYFAEAAATAQVEQNLQRQFQHELAALHQLQEFRSAELLERCRTLSWRPRIHAALEDNALDLLYPSAEGELRDLVDTTAVAAEPDRPPKAAFYRFLDRDGRVIAPLHASSAGRLGPNEEMQLNFKKLPQHQEIGYIKVHREQRTELLKVIAMPILSTETGQVISAIILGFHALASENPGAAAAPQNSAINSGIWVNDALYIPTLDTPATAELSRRIAQAIARDPDDGRFEVTMEHQTSLLVYHLINPLSQFPAAYDISVYSLGELQTRRAQIRWQIGGGSLLLLLIGLTVSHIVAGKLSVPVEKLEIASAENLARRQRAEAALESTSLELQRSTRFSADASHQLKTPVSVLRAGLEEWLARPNLTVDDINELAGLVHQTYRLATVIEDLLLLSRIDTGHLHLELVPVNLRELIDGWLDDFSTLPDPWELKIEADVPPELFIAGEKRYTTMILQNLLENARKYNRRAGRVHISARTEGAEVYLSVGNTGKTIPHGAREHIFERFHRGNMGENVPGHGLGLNLARELARNHEGDLRLVGSDEDWTVFQVKFLLASRSAVLPQS